jgi:DNA polymerase-3 subunit alpha
MRFSHHTGLKDACVSRIRAGGQPDYTHPAMERVLAETHGVILYQEQFLRLVHELAGFSLAGAESLRKALARNPGPDERAALRARFVAGAIGNDIAQPVAEQLWETLVGYTGFGFCKGHAAAYATVAYRTAYCKAHYPAELLAAMLSNQAGFYPAQVYIEEARRLGIRLRPPDINRSALGTRARGGTIQLGLGAVRGLRRATLAALLATRREGGPFRSLRELLGRVSLSKGEVTALIEVGALDRVAGGRSRPELLWQARLWAPAVARAQAATQPNGQGELPLPEALPDLPATMPALRPYSLAERLGLEGRTLGVTLSANPLLPYRALLARQGAVPAPDVAAHAGESVVVGGVPVAMRRHALRPGVWIGFLTLQDLRDLIEVVLEGDALEGALPALAAGGPVLVRGVVERANHGAATVRATKVRALRWPADKH